MIEIEHFEKLLTLLKTIKEDQNININIQRKPLPLNGVDAASNGKSRIVKRKIYRYFSIRRYIDVLYILLYYIYYIYLSILFPSLKNT